MTIGEIFKKALKAKVGTRAAVFDYGDKDTFSGLWEISDNGVPEVFKEQDQGRNRSIIIVWDGRPLDDDDGSGDLPSHLTPLDWALAFSVQALARGIPCGTNITAHIVDLTSQDHVEWSMGIMRHALLAAMPWVTLHSPLILDAAYRSGYAPIWTTTIGACCCHRRRHRSRSGVPRGTVSVEFSTIMWSSGPRR